MKTKIIIIVAVIAIGIGSYLLLPRAKKGLEEVGVLENCEGADIKFNYPPADMEMISYIVPMGRVFSEHVAPTDHQYYISSEGDIPENEQKIDINVYAPASGTIEIIEHMGSFAGDIERPAMDDYRLNIKHSCGLSSAFIHIDDLSPRLAKAAPDFGEFTHVDVFVEAGEVIGTYRGSLDYNVIDEKITIGLIEPESYEEFEQRLHISDPFDYFNDKLREQLISKSLRTAEPEGGTIDYDVDGRLTGVWFEEGTNGWNGINRQRYWAGHLAIVYHHVDEDHIILSFGTFEEGIAKQFGVKGNTPDPSEVSAETGLIKYELVGYSYYYEGQPVYYRDIKKGVEVRNEEQAQGIVLFQLIEDRKLKVEVFPNKTSDEVSGFTENAVIYGR